jgi:hypothetical protein
MYQTEGAIKLHVGLCKGNRYSAVLKVSSRLSEVNELRTEPMVENYLFLEQAEGYVKTPEKSSSPLSTMRKVFEHGGPND